MILSENQLKVPGKQYKIRVKCVKTQRLTTIEWLILNCTKKFRDLSAMQEKTLKYAFEDVFQFQNSELLIKPCLKHLQNLGVIYIASGENFDYENLRFFNIIMTEKGEKMLQDGLLPGEPWEVPLDIYYNPLTGQISSFNVSNIRAKDVIDFGTETDYSDLFPEQHIIEELQSGSLGGNRFIASNARIEELDAIASSDWESVVTVTTEIDDMGELKISPEIVEPGVDKLIANLFYTKEITKAIAEKYPNSKEVDIKNIIGSSGKIKEAILDVCKNGRIVFMDARSYTLYKRNTTSFKDTVLFLFNAGGEFTIENEKGLIIHIPNEFPIKGCVAVNEKGQHVSLCRADYRYKQEPITVPLAVQDAHMFQNNKVALEWLEEVILEKTREDIRYVSLYTLDMLKNNIKKCKEYLYTRWNDMEVQQILFELGEIHGMCSKLKTDMIEMDSLLEVILEKVNFNNSKDALKTISVIMASNCIKKQSASYQKAINDIIVNIKRPETYLEFSALLNSLGITTHDDALLYDDIVGPLYGEKIINDLLIKISSDKFKELPELFELDSFFNGYAQGLKQIEMYVSGLKLFDKMNRDILSQSVAGCPDIAGLQSYMAEILSKNAYLMSRGINVYDVIKQSDDNKANAFIENMREIEKCIKHEIEGVYQQEEEQTNVLPTSTEKKKMYILDTCALMHEPELLLYFAEDEYVRIPTKVIDELGKIKDKRNDKYDVELSKTAKDMVWHIGKYYMKYFNQQNKVRFIIENAEIDNLPVDLDPNVPDNQILSVALKYKDWDTYIISDDGAFILTAISQNMKGITSEEFIKTHKESFKAFDEMKQQVEKLSNVKKVLVETQGEEVVRSQIVDENNEFIEMSIDDLPLRTLKKYVPDFNEQIFAYLNSCKIKTIGDFRKLNETKIGLMPAKGQQQIYKNNILRTVKQMDQIISKIKL